MKKRSRIIGILMVVLFAPMCLTACLDDEEEQWPKVVRQTDYTITMASRQVKVDVPYDDELVAYAIKWEGTAEWMRFHYVIEGFDYEPGYEYVLRVRETVYYDERMADSQTYTTYQLLELVSKEQKESEGLPESFPSSH